MNTGNRTVDKLGRDSLPVSLASATTILIASFADMDTVQVAALTGFLSVGFTAVWRVCRDKMRGQPRN